MASNATGRNVVRNNGRAEMEAYDQLPPAIKEVFDLGPIVLIPTEITQLLRMHGEAYTLWIMDQFYKQECPRWYGPIKPRRKNART